MLIGLIDTPAPRLKLVVKSGYEFSERTLMRVLIGICGLNVYNSFSNDGREVHMTIEGNASAADVEIAAEMLCPEIIQFLDIQPKWGEGMIGLMQLITLSHISQALTSRLN
jgi:hypothetical protein